MTAIPSALKVPETSWPTPWASLDLAVAEIRVHTNVPPFANDDELGIFNTARGRGRGISSKGVQMCFVKTRAQASGLAS